MLTSNEIKLIMLLVNKKRKKKNKMTTLLIILAHPHTDDFSWSLATVEEFKKSYQESHPLDKIIIRDLFSEKVPALDNETFAAWKRNTSTRRIFRRISIS